MKSQSNIKNWLIICLIILVSANSVIARQGVRPVPEVSFNDLSGSTISLQGLRGKDIFLLFGNTNCHYCEAAITSLKSISETAANHGLPLEVMYIGLRQTSGELINDFSPNLTSIRIVPDPDLQISVSFGIEHVPTLVYIDQDGLIRYSGRFQEDMVWRLLSGESFTETETIYYNDTPMLMNASVPVSVVHAPMPELPPLSEALDILPPLGSNKGNRHNYDPTLADFLTISVWKVLGEDDFELIEELSLHDDKQLGKLNNNFYHVNWKVSKELKGQELMFHFAVEGLSVGSLRYTAKSNRMLPIKFRIENHPSIWARVLRSQGTTAMDTAKRLMDQFDLTEGQITLLLYEEDYDVFGIGMVLRDLFGLAAQEVAQLLKDIGSYPATEITEVLLGLFDFDNEAAEIAQILKNIGFGASKILDILKAPPFNMTDQEAIAILESLGFTSEDLFGATSRALAEQFAPQLRFDKAAWAFPMSAQEYFDNNIESSVGPIENTDPSTLTAADPSLVPPTYFKAFKVGDQIRILYWWYYGWQPGCWEPIVGVEGTHDGDWERVMVILSEDELRVIAVTYWQHSGWYTRLAQGGDTDRFLGASYDPGLSFYGDHPIVFVGKGQHGSYHDEGGWGDSISGGGLSYCDYYADWRNNEGHSDLWLDCEKNLKSLADLEEDWMLEETSVVDSLIDYGDGSTIAFDLDSKYVKETPLKVRLDGQDINSTDFSFSNNSGTDGMDQIVFNEAPGVDVEITADWERGDFRWGCGPCRENGISTHPVKSSTYSGVASRASCKGFDATILGKVRGCFESQCEYHDNKTGWTDFHPGTCSHCPAGYTDMGFYCGKGSWPWEWSTREIHYYGLEYSISRTNEGLSISR